MLGIGMGQNILDEIVSILITSDWILVSKCFIESLRALTIDQRDAGTIGTPLADSLEVALQKFSSTNLETLLDDLGGELIHTVLGGIPKDMVDGTATVSWGTMLTDVLDAPVAKLAVSNYVDAGEDLVDARALCRISTRLMKVRCN